MSVSSTSVLLTTVLALAIGVLLQVSSTNGQCCSNRGDFQCCGNGPCNFFCCNCDRGCAGGCSFNPGNAIAIGSGVLGLFGGRKRQVHDRIPIGTQSASQHQITRNTFNQIDLNKDQIIDFSEGLAYLQNVTKLSKRKRSVEKEDVNKFVIEFGSMDTNGDGVVEPHEFDRTLA